MKGCEVYFPATFSWTSPLSDRKVPNFDFGRSYVEWYNFSYFSSYLHLRVSRNKITETGVIHVQLGTRLTQGTQRVQKTCQTVKQKANQ